MSVVLSIDKSLETRISEVFELQRNQVIALRKAPLSKRVERLNKLKKWILNNKEHICDAIYKDYKKPHEETDFSEVFPVVSEIRYTVKHLKKWATNKKVDTPLPMLGSSSYIKYEPKGVCLIIAPWNYPFQLLVGPLVSAIAAGNKAIVKPSELTPNTSALLKRMIEEVFLKEDVALFEGGVGISKHLLSLPFDHIFFTGSPAVGKIVMEAAAKNLTSVTLELGGKSPTIVDETANINQAAERIAWAKLMNNGQTCVAPDYVLVHTNVKHDLVNALKRHMNKMYGKDNEDYKQSFSYGRIVNQNHHKRLQGILDDAIEKGAKPIIGGDMEIRTGYFSPTILSNVSFDMKVMKEEIFGPLLPVIEFSNLDEAIQIINEKPKALALYIYSSSTRNQNKILNETSSGGVCINENMVHFAHHNLPFGGVNNSGIGKAHGHAGFIAFSNEKAVLKQWFPFNASKMVYPPFTHLKRKVLDLLIKHF